MGLLPPSPSRVSSGLRSHLYKGGSLSRQGWIPWSDEHFPCGNHLWTPILALYWSNGSDWGHSFSVIDHFRGLDHVGRRVLVYISARIVSFYQKHKLESCHWVLPDVKVTNTLKWKKLEEKITKIENVRTHLKV